MQTIATMLKDGKRPREIIAALGAPPHQINKVRKSLRMKPFKAGRPSGIADVNLSLRVAEMRASGLTLSQIGVMLGVTKQAVQIRVRKLRQSTIKPWIGK